MTPWVPLYWRGKVRGQYHIGREAYVSPRNEKHVCIKHHAWGIQKEILENLKRRRCKWIVILYQRTPEHSRVAYIAKFWDFVDHGIYDTLNPMDGEQVFLPFGYFEEKTEDDMPQTTLQQVWTPANEPPTPSNAPGAQE